LTNTGDAASSRFAMFSSEIRPPTIGTASGTGGHPYPSISHADVLALLPDPETAKICLDIAEDAAQAVHGSMAAAHVGARPLGMIVAPEEIDLQMLRDLAEGTSLQRFELVNQIFQSWRRGGPDRRDLLMDDCRGDLDRCVAVQCHESALVVSPCHGNLDARDAFHAIIFNERKLVLVPPPGRYAGHLLGHVVIGWKPHHHARGAVIAAKRWLAAADRVTVLCVNDTADHTYQATARELLAELGLQADIVAMRSENRSVGETILDFARSERATCLLIGAFKHSYFLELLLGRVTRYLLSRATMPLLMKH
jgi:nucleotide-binding universal stress UspA family protein